MTQFLPPNLLALFTARDPVPFLPPVDKPTHEKKREPYTGVADYLTQFEDPEETPEPVKLETKTDKLERKAREKAEQNAYKLEQDLALWNPAENENATTDPYRTLFVARIHYDTSESKLRREFETYGKIKTIKLVHDNQTDKPRGYAFIEYEDESSMHAAYKRADGKKIDGKRVIVDIERGRTIKGWKPRRLGGGKGGRKSHFVDTIDGPGEDGNSSSRIQSERPERYERAERGERGDRDRGGDRVERNGGGDRGDRGDRDRDRERKRSKERGRTSKSRSRDRSDRKKRSKSRDRSREKPKKIRRSRSKDKSDKSSLKRKERSRSRDRIRKDDYVDTKNGKENHIKLEPKLEAV